jgi:hypothetical protein
MSKLKFCVDLEVTLIPHGLRQEPCLQIVLSPHADVASFGRKHWQVFGTVNVVDMLTGRLFSASDGL